MHDLSFQITWPNFRTPENTNQNNHGNPTEIPKKNMPKNDDDDNA